MSQPATWVALAVVAALSACGTEIVQPNQDVQVGAGDGGFSGLDSGATWGTDPDDAGSTGDEVDADTTGQTGTDDASDAEAGGADDSTTGSSEPAPGTFLHGCDDNGDCFSGFCVDSPDGPVCSKTCEDDGSCPGGWSCSEIAVGGDPTFICIPDDTFLCRPCQDDDDCNIAGYPKSGVCLEAGSLGSFCSRMCEAVACPDAFECAGLKPYGEEGPEVLLCSADSQDVCGCTSKFVSEGAKTTCYIENDFGRCYGETLCLEEGPLPNCAAPDPAPEVCNGVDDDCDGETDEDAVDCTVFFVDSDDDGYGLGTVGECLCEQPGPKWITLGGDCNEQVTAINPGATEACNLWDDDCDLETDEEGADGCTIHYLDQDEDGFGLDDVTACFCSGKEGWSPVPGDCNDLDPTANPSIEEQCDTIDNDCDEAVDEIGAVGCNPFFLDQDADGYGLSDQVKCLCGPTGVYIGNKPNDCDDVSPNVNPGVPELCNGIDDNCNSDTDEGDAASMCPQVASGEAECVDGTCQLTSCEPGWSDADGDPLNGCECPLGQLEQPGGVGNSCGDPQAMGTLVDAGSEALVTDNVAPATDEDWYHFNAIDGADPNSCDTWDLRVAFVHNPQEQFVFDVYQGGCAASQEICKEVDNYTHTTAISTMIGDQLVGECPCTPDVETTDGFQHCSDQTNGYWIRVYRRPELEATCAAYTLRVTNGM